MDQQKLRTLVFEKTGIKVDSDDPIFALVALNEAVLAETVERHVALLNAAAQELALQARACGGQAAPPLFVSAAPVAAAPDQRRLLIAAAGVAIFSTLLVLGAQALFFRPAPASAPATPTSEAATAIERGERLEQALRKLDPASRKLIQTELQKP